jgi:uncharacterized protein (TIGR04255 family)
MKLPTRLRNEPLLDAVFECRFIAPIPLSNILPGILFSEFSEEKQIERLPQLDIPEVIRNRDPKLQYAPLIRINLNGYSILIGDRSIAVSCKLPYRGWIEFKSKIINIINIVKKSNLVDQIIRYSIKYIDLIQATDPTEQVNLANLSLTVGNHKLTKESYQVRMDIPVDGLINIVQIVSGAKVTMPDKTMLEGVLIDIDTIKETGNIPIKQLEEEALNEALEQIHIVNKKTFFDCLTEQTLMQLEPEYE